MLNFYVAASRGVNHNSRVPAAELDTKIRALSRVDSSVGQLLDFIRGINGPNFDKKSGPRSVPRGLPVGDSIGST